MVCFFAFPVLWKIIVDLVRNLFLLNLSVSMPTPDERNEAKELLISLDMIQMQEILLVIVPYRSFGAK